jgi:Ice-binding-like/Secretion system C-terminal sorting domain
LSRNIPDKDFIKSNNMKNKLMLTIFVGVSLLSSPEISSGQTPDLGTAANFALFSSAGAVSNTGISQITGNIGTNVGAISGFGNVNGVNHTADASTAQAVIDLQAAWYYLVTLTPTSTIGPVLGSGQVLFAGVDTIAAAGSVVGALIFDAQGNPNAVFIIKTGGALTTAAGATVTLINGAVACNVFWVADGAISMAASTTMRGTLIANNGAIDMGAGGILEGRELSTTGAVSVYGTIAYTPLGCAAPILTGPIAPVLNSVACFTLFSANGALSNSGITNINGDVGSNSSTTSGYNPLLVTGTIHPVPDASTAQCATDFQNLYTYVSTIPDDIELLFPAQFGNSLVLTPHTYVMNAATLLTDSLYLDAEGNASAIFIIQINGALSTSAFSSVTLINGAQANNVYWVVQGAVNINNNSTFCGNIVCNNGAISLGTGVNLAGRALTTAGIINTTAMTANNSFGGACTPLAIQLLSFTGVCAMQTLVLNWSTATETNNKSFTVQRSEDGMNWQTVGTIDGAGTSSTPRTYSLTDKLPGKSISYYRLMLTAFDGENTYSIVITVGKCGIGTTESFTLYPNPSTGSFILLFTGDRTQVSSIEIFNSAGEQVYGCIGFQSTFNLSGKPPGEYFLRIHLPSKTVNLEVVVVK